MSGDVQYELNTQTIKRKITNNGGLSWFENETTVLLSYNIYMSYIRTEHSIYVYNFIMLASQIGGLYSSIYLVLGAIAIFLNRRVLIAK